jgi:hypothetical protein
MTEIRDNVRKFEFEIDESDDNFKRPRGFNFDNMLNGSIKAIDLLISGLTDRLMEQEFSKSFEIIRNYQRSKFQIISWRFQKDRLKNELNIIYASPEFDNIINLISLLKFLMNNYLKDTFKESVKVIEIVLTAPIASAEAERCFSTLKRIKSFA